MSIEAAGPLQPFGAFGAQQIVPVKTTRRIGNEHC